MYLFDWLVIAHLVGDYLVQTESEAMGKAQGKFLNKALIAHCLKYTASFLPVLLFFHLHLAWLAFIFGTHMVLDRRSAILWWRKYVTRNSDESIKATFWLTVAVDQVFHILVIAVIGGLAT